MSHKTVPYTARELFGEISDPALFLESDTGFEKYWKWPEEIGAGFMYMVKLRPGLMLGIGDYRLTKKIAVQFENNLRAVAFAYSASGSMQYTLDQGEERRDVWHFKQGSGVMAYLPEIRGTAVTTPGLSVNCIGLYIEPWLLADLMGQDRNQLPRDIYSILQGKCCPEYYRLFDATAAANIIVHQIVNCPYQGALKRLYYESKALELITHSMAALAPQAPARPAHKLPLNPEDAKRIRHVRRVLEREFQNPPRLMDLARSVGVSHPKLNSCFREAYGATIFEYLREVRLSRARSLLEEGRMNVTEAAFEVGYASLSHFAKAFREHFGASPGHYLRGQLQ
jgi:AraC-like DNA-binding protein